MIGIDLVRIKRIKELMNDKDALEKIFNSSEITDNAESLAGIFAAKEAYFKAKGSKEDWLSVEITKNKEGKPFIASDERAELSITHEGEYAAAVVIIKDE